HLYSLRYGPANHSADYQRTDNPRIIIFSRSLQWLQQCSQKTKNHSRQRNQISIGSCSGMAQHADSYRKTKNRDQIQNRNYTAHNYFFSFLNIFNIRSVTAYPPTILIIPRMIDKLPNIKAK